MTCELWRALGAALAAFTVCAAPRAAAQSTPLITAGEVFDSRSPTAASLVYARWPLSESAAINVSQLGWTTGAGFSLALDSELTWRTTVEVSPVRAHLSHDVYQADGTTATDEYDDTALRAGTEVIAVHAPLEVRVQALVVKHWLSKAEWPAVRAFDAPFAGVESTIVLSNARNYDPFEALAEGLRLTLRGEVLIGDELWSDADATLSWGAEVGPLFLHVRAMAFYVYLDTPASNVLVGGSWDVLGANGLWGYPLGAFRLPAGATSTAGIDVDVWRPLRIGLRGSVLVGAPEVHAGLGVQLHAVLSGVHVFTAIATSATEPFEAIAVTGGVQAALLFLP